MNLYDPVLPAAGVLSTPDRWPAALAHLRAAHAAGGRINYIGGPADSITDGLGATSRDDGWWSVFADTMSGALARPSRAPGSVELSLDCTWPLWTTPETGVHPDVRGLGRHGIALERGAVVATTQACDRFRLVYNRTSTAYGLRGGTLAVHVDGALVAELDCGGSDVCGLMWDSDHLGEFAPHHIELGCVAGGLASVSHAYFHDGVDADTGPLFWRSAHRRFSAADDNFGFTEAASPWTGCFTRGIVGENPYNGRPVLGAGTIEPDCFLCATGTNDILRFGNDRARLQSAYEHVFDYIRARCDNDPSIGVVVPTSSTRFEGRFQPLYDAIEAACEASGAFFIDLWHGLGTHGDDRHGYYFDGIHPNDRGHAAWAAYVSAWMLSAVSPASG